MPRQLWEDIVADTKARRLQVHIEGLRRNIAKLAKRLNYMTGPEFCPPHGCCPSCAWGPELDKVHDALSRREMMLSTLLCRQAGLKPQKLKVVQDISWRACGACGGGIGGHTHALRPSRGRTSIGSVGPCMQCRTAEERRTCPGRGVCHSCKGKGTVRVETPRHVVIRPWPEGYDPNVRYGRAS